MSAALLAAAGLLFHVEATDPLTFGLSTAVLLVAALAAGALPAWSCAGGPGADFAGGVRVGV